MGEEWFFHELHIDSLLAAIFTVMDIDFFVHEVGLN